MFHDPEMEVTCDHTACQNSLFLPMQWSTGGYDLSDSNAEKILTNDHDWLVVDGVHLCDSCKDDFNL